MEYEPHIIYSHTIANTGVFPFPFSSSSLSLPTHSSPPAAPPPLNLQPPPAAPPRRAALLELRQRAGRRSRMGGLGLGRQAQLCPLPPQLRRWPLLLCWRHLCWRHRARGAGAVMEMGFVSASMHSDWGRWPSSLFCSKQAASWNTRYYPPAAINSGSFPTVPAGLWPSPTPSLLPLPPSHTRFLSFLL